MNKLIKKPIDLVRYFKNMVFYFFHRLWNPEISFLEKLVLSIKSGAYISSKSSLYRHCKIKLGNRVTIHRYAQINAKSPGGRLIIGDYVEVMPFAVVSPQKNGEISIGSNSTIQYGARLYGRGGLRIGKGVRIAANTVIVAQNHRFETIDVPIWKQGAICKGIVIEDNVWIGANATVLDGVHIGSGAVVGAGAVVSRDVKANIVVVGIPAKEIRKRI